MNSRRLVAVLACRNTGSRLYGKPLQPLNIATGWRVLDQVIANLKRFDFIEEIVLAISDGNDNLCYKDYAQKSNIPFVIGDEEDVLKRLIIGLDLVKATDLFRVTSESPFLYWQAVSDAWQSHVSNHYDATFLDGIVDGCGFEIITYESLCESWSRGNHRHRSELCSLFLRENRDYFSICQIPEPTALLRRDLRLTVDYPEDLVVCRAVFDHLQKSNHEIDYDLNDIVSFLDQSPSLTSLVYPFTEEGYKNMYL